MTKSKRLIAAVLALALTPMAHAGNDLAQQLSQGLANALKGALTGNSTGTATDNRAASQGVSAGPGTASAANYVNRPPLEPLGVIPVLSSYQYDRVIRLRKGERLKVGNMMSWAKGPLGLYDQAFSLFPRDQMAQTYRERYASFNHNDAFKLQEFEAFAKSYVYGAENFFAKLDMFAVEEGCGSIGAFSASEQGFPLRLHRPGADRPDSITLRFPETTMRKLESLRAANDLCVMPFLRMNAKGDVTPVGVQMFEMASRKALLVTTFGGVSDQDYEFIRKNAFGMRPLNASFIQVEPAETSVYDQRQGAAPAADTRTSSNTTIACSPGEDALLALSLKTEKTGTVVTFKNLATGEQNWTRMTADILRAMNIKKGSAFCMAP